MAKIFGFFLSFLLGLVLGLGIYHTIMFSRMQQHIIAREKAARELETLLHNEMARIAEVKSIEHEQLKTWIAELQKQSAEFAKIQSLLHKKELELERVPATLYILTVLIIGAVVGAIAFISRSEAIKDTTTIENALTMMPPAIKRLLVEATAKNTPAVSIQSQQHPQIEHGTDESSPGG